MENFFGSIFSSIISVDGILQMRMKSRAAPVKGNQRVPIVISQTFFCLKGEDRPGLKTWYQSMEMTTWLEPTLEVLMMPSLMLRQMSASLQLLAYSRGAHDAQVDAEAVVSILTNPTFPQPRRRRCVSFRYQGKIRKGDYRLCRVVQTFLDSKDLVRKVEVEMRLRNSRGPTLPYVSKDLVKQIVMVQRLVKIPTEPEEAQDVNKSDV